MPSDAHDETSETSAGSGELSHIEKDVFRDVIGHFASGVTVITTRAHGENFGITVSACSSLSLEPPMLLICINTRSRAQAAISESGTFAVNILEEDQAHLAERFATAGIDKFAGVEVQYGKLGNPLLEEALAHLECQVTEEVTGGTHSIFLGVVQHADRREGFPLAYFRGKFGRLELELDRLIHTEIRERIIGETSRLGDVLTADAVARVLDAPRAAVHHALTKLTSQGLLRREQGAFVVGPVGPEACEDALDARCVLELGVARARAGSLSAEELTGLRRRMEVAQGFVRDGHVEDPDRYVEAADAFHEYLIGLAGSEALVDAYRRLGLPMIMKRALSDGPKAVETRKSAIEQHRVLLDALERGDAEAAAAAIVRHAELVKRAYRRTLGAAAA